MPHPAGPRPFSPQVEAELPSATATTAATAATPMRFTTQQFVKETLLRMPVEVIGNILKEWVKLEWFAPAVARRICRLLKEITDSSPYLWSKLFLPGTQRVYPDHIRQWQSRAKAAPREVLIGVNGHNHTSAALEPCDHITTLIYNNDWESSGEQIRLPRYMPQLRYLRVDTRLGDKFLGWWNTSAFRERSYNSGFPCLTVLQLSAVDLTGFRLVPGLFPTVLHLFLGEVRGPIRDLVEACSDTVEELRINLCLPECTYSHIPIALPSLKVLIYNFPGDAFWFNAPALRLIQGNLKDVFGLTRPLNSVVEWITCNTCEVADITIYLFNMPQLQRLMICESVETLVECFEFLRDYATVCPNLELIEVVENAWRLTVVRLDANVKEYLEACVARRAETVPGFTLQFVHEDIQMTWIWRYGKTHVCSFSIMRHYLSYNDARPIMTPLRTP